MEQSTSTYKDKYEKHCQTIRKQKDKNIVPPAKVKKKIAPEASEMQTAAAGTSDNPKNDKVCKKLFVDQDITELSIINVELNTKMCLNKKVPDLSFNKNVLVDADASQVNVDHSKYTNKQTKRHICQYCNKVFKSNGKLNNHVYSHTGERPFKCTKCIKAFSSKFKLVRHHLIHSEIRKFVCPICDRTFLRNDHLKNHIKIHDPLKHFYCCDRPECNKKYSSQLSYKKHVAWHLVEDGVLSCYLCNKKFESKTEIEIHLKTHSGSRLFKTQLDKKFKCQICDRLFLTKKDVTRHLVVHTGNRDFLCQYCPQRFGRKDHLVRHIKKSHITEKKKRVRTVNRNLDKYKKKETTTTTTVTKPIPDDTTTYLPNTSITIDNSDKNDVSITEECLFVTNNVIYNQNTEVDVDKEMAVVKNEIDDTSVNIKEEDIFVGGCDDFDSIQLLSSNEFEGSCLSLGVDDNFTNDVRGDDSINLLTNNPNGGEILRSLLMSNEDIFTTTLPGFNQIFHSPASN